MCICDFKSKRGYRNNSVVLSVRRTRVRVNHGFMVAVCEL